MTGTEKSNPDALDRLGKRGVASDRVGGEVVGIGRRPPTTWVRFRGQKPSMIGLVLLGALFVIAALAPFLAGNRPILFADGEGLELPVFGAFTQEDFFWFASLAGGLLVFAFRRILFPIRPDRSSDRRRRIALFLFGLAVAVIVVIGLAWPEKLVHDDYTPFRDGECDATLCVFPPVCHAPTEVPLTNTLDPPSLTHLFGTDRQGDDILSRMIHGTRISLLVAITAILVCLAIGVALGAAAGFFGGWVDAFVLRLIEVVTCFPAFFAVLAVLAFLPPRIFWVMLIIGLLRWPGVARLTRGEFLRLRDREFVAAARALGLSNGRIMARHILPNALAPVIVSATFGMAGAILIESGLSFLGIGPANCQSWGRLLSEFRPYFDVAWWLSVFPGISIFVTVIALNLVGEGLRDAFDPRLRE